MDAPCITVKCSVENCSFNKQSMCYANGLEVNTTGNRVAESSDGTCCTTFKDTK